TGGCGSQGCERKDRCDAIIEILPQSLRWRPHANSGANSIGSKVENRVLKKSGYLQQSRYTRPMQGMLPIINA
ncbi:hypothetical protein, partial [Agrobacterium vitis]|uniref:hypothetical protein n=1 Tax=Agrobacterium vitis TaxID=373 RepID=UPI001AED214F